MKKTYLKPELEVVSFNLHQCILTGSEPEVDVRPDDDPIDPDGFETKEKDEWQDIWDEDAAQAQDYWQ